MTTKLLVFNPGIIPIPKSRDLGEKSNPEIPGLLRINPGIFGIGFFLNLTLLCFVWKLIYCSRVQTCSNSLSDCNNKTLSSNFIWQKWRFMRTLVRNVCTMYCRSWAWNHFLLDKENQNAKFNPLNDFI